MNDPDAELAFYEERSRLLKAREQAYANRDVDRAAWDLAKHEYAEFRTTMRYLAEMAGTRTPGVTVGSFPPPVPED